MKVIVKDFEEERVVHDTDVSYGSVSVVIGNKHYRLREREIMEGVLALEVNLIVEGRGNDRLGTLPHVSNVVYLVAVTDFRGKGGDR